MVNKNNLASGIMNATLSACTLFLAAAIVVTDIAAQKLDNPNKKPSLFDTKNKPGKESWGQYYFRRTVTTCATGYMAGTGIGYAIKAVNDFAHLKC